MSVLYVALPIALLLGGAALTACLVCIRTGQYDDLETPSIKLLNDEMKSWCGEAKSPSLGEGRPEAGEGELNWTIALGTSPSPRFARPSQREGVSCRCLPEPRVSCRCLPEPQRAPKSPSLEEGRPEDGGVD